MFDEQYPFYQVPDLDEKSVTTVAKLAPHLSSGNNATLFNHSCDKFPKKITSAQAARGILAIQNFDLGGLVGPYKSKRFSNTDKSAKAANLARAAMIIISSKTLYKTLILNLVKYNTALNIPYDFRGDDKPVWERKLYTLPEERLPNGLVDWYTWQSRVIKLIPDRDGYISEIIFMKGESLPKGFHRKNFETMVAFRKTKLADPWLAIGFNEKRVIWRNSNALFQTNEASIKPKTIDWISELQFESIIAPDDYPIMLFGCSSDKASFKLWRKETLPFNPKQLSNNDFTSFLDDALNITEKVSQALWSGLNALFINLISDIHQKNQNKPKLDKKDTDRLKKKIENSNIEQQFWAELSLEFKNILIKAFDNPKSVDIKDWKKEIKKKGAKILERYIKSSNFDSRSLKAGILAQKRYYWRLKSV